MKTIIFVLPLSFQVQAQPLLCEDLFYQKERIEYKSSEVGRPGRSLREVREDRLKDENRDIKRTQKGTFARIWNGLKRLFSGKATQKDIEDLFGRGWKKYIRDGVVKLQDLDITDAQFLQIIKYAKNNGKGIKFDINLHGNRQITTRTLLELLNSDLEIIKLDLYDIEIKTLSVVDAIVRRQPGLRELTIDNISDAALKILSLHRNLRKLDLDNAVVGYTKFGNYIYTLNHAIALVFGRIVGVNTNRPTFDTVSAYEFNNFVTVKGIEEFLDQQTREEIYDRLDRFFDRETTPVDIKFSGTSEILK